MKKKENICSISFEGFFYYIFVQRTELLSFYGVLHLDHMLLMMIMLIFGSEVTASEGGVFRDTVLVHHLSFTDTEKQQNQDRTCCNLILGFFYFPSPLLYLCYLFVMSL